MALVEGDRVVTFARARGLAAAAAGGIAGLGVAPGDRVAIACHNDIGFVTVVPRRALGRRGGGAVEPARARLGARGPGRAGRRAGPRRAAPGTEDLLELPGAVAVERAPGRRRRCAAEVERDDAELAVLLFTSGTAGAPRAAMLTHGNLAANIGQVQGHPGLRVARRRRRARGAAVLPRVRAERRARRRRCTAGCRRCCSTTSTPRARSSSIRDARRHDPRRASRRCSARSSSCPTTIAPRDDVRVGAPRGLGRGRAAARAGRARSATASASRSTRATASPRPRRS